MYFLGKEAVPLSWDQETFQAVNGTGHPELNISCQNRSPAKGFDTKKKSALRI
jgi:hypothetical protein